MLVSAGNIKRDEIQRMIGSRSDVGFFFPPGISIEFDIIEENSQLENLKVFHFRLAKVIFQVKYRNNKS